MNPMLLQMLQRFGPRASGMLSNGFGTKLGMIQTPEPLISPNDPTAPAAGPSPPISSDNSAPPVAPPAPQGMGSANEMVSQGFNALGPTPMQSAMATPAPMPGHGFNSPPPVMAQGASAPMPQPRPEEAPQDMGFFARNSAMMTDPMTGEFIDPSRASKASGPDVIAKLMDYFHKKDPS